MEEPVTWDSSIASEGIHHTGVGRDGKYAGMEWIVSHRIAVRDRSDPPAEVHASDDQYHQHDGTLGTHRVKKDLCHRLTSLGVDRSVHVLNRKQQSKDEEPAQNRGDTDSHHNADRSSHSGVVRFFRHLDARFNRKGR